MIIYNYLQVQCQLIITYFCKVIWYYPSWVVWKLSSSLYNNCTINFTTFLKKVSHYDDCNMEKSKQALLWNKLQKLKKSYRL